MDRRQLLKWLGGAVVAAPLVAKAVPRDFSTPVMTYKCRELAPSKFLTSNTAWWVQTNAPKGLVVAMRRRLEKSMEGDFDTDSMRYKATERYNPNWIDPRCVWGTPGL